MQRENDLMTKSGPFREKIARSLTMSNWFTYLGRSLFNNTTLYKVLFHDVLRKMYMLPSLFVTYLTQCILATNLVILEHVFKRF